MLTYLNTTKQGNKTIQPNIKHNIITRVNTFIRAYNYFNSFGEKNKGGLGGSIGDYLLSAFYNSFKSILITENITFETKQG